MAGNSKACFTVISYEENYKLFDTTVQQEIEFWKSQKVSGVAVGLHHKEINDKNHEHWMLGYAKSAPDVSGFIDILKSRNAELQERAKASGKDISIVLESGEVVERCMYKIYTGRYAKKHCVYDPESMELYLSHSTPQCKKDGKVQYDPDKDVIYSDGFDLDSYLSRDAIQKAKGNKEDIDVDYLEEITDIIDVRHIYCLPVLIKYLKAKKMRYLLSFCISHTAIVTSYISDMRYNDYPHGTNSVDAGEIPPKNDDIPDPGCAAKEAPFVDAPADETPAPADADLTCVESKEANSTYAREEAPEDEHSPLPAEGASRKAREADTFETSDIEHVTPEMLKGLKSVRRASSSSVKTSNSSTAEEDLFNDSELEFAELDFDPFV